MSIFKKKEGVSVEAQLEEAIALNLELTQTNVTLVEENTNFKLAEKITSAGTKIGFTGKVSDLLTDGCTYESAMEAMISSLETQTEAEVESFEESGSKEVGTGDNDEFVAKTQKEAFKHVENEYGLEGRDKVLRAQELFPNIFKEGE